MRTRVIAAVLILWLVTLGTAKPGISLFGPAMSPGALGDLEIIGPVAQYQLWVEVSFAPGGPLISGHERLGYVNNEGVTLGELYLRLYPNGQSIYGAGSLGLGNVTVNGEPITPHLELGGGVALIQLAEPLSPGEELLMELDFSGLVPQGFAGRNGSSYGIYDYSGGVLKLANWFPILAAYDEEGWHLDPIYGWGDAVYSETALFEVWITAPSDQLVVASGTEVGRMANPDGTVTHHYISGPMRDFFIGMSPDFKRLTATVEETTVNSYYLEGDSPGGRAALAAAANAIALFSRLYGAYPFSEFDLIETPLPWVGGVEYPGLVLTSDRLYGSREYLEREKLQFAMIVSHEVAHQWWYSLVGNDVIGEPWLDEALATYSSGAFVAEFLGEADFRELFSDWERSYRRARAELDTPITASLDYFSGNYDYLRIVYYGGALFYRALRAELGDELFFAALQEYFQQFKYRVATTEDLLGIFEEVSGQELGELYDRWLFAPARSATPLLLGHSARFAAGSTTEE